MNAFTIRDLESLTGVKAHTIRIWEQRYGFIKPQRTDTNIRFYNNDELKTILNISLLNKYGYKISKINQMSNVEMKEKILHLSQAEAIQEKIINDLIQHMIDLDTKSFELVLDQQILLKGIEKTILETIFPYMERIGVLWITNHINPAQEHLVSNIIRQKLLVGTESIKIPYYTNKQGLLFLPESEFHEIGLLFVQFLLKSNGVSVIYLGANAPLNDVEYIIKHKKPDFLYTHLTMQPNGFHLEKYLNKLHLKAGHTPIIIGGRATQSFDKKLPKEIVLVRGISDLMNFIEQ